jgi:site-specific recombinase XerD
MSARKTTKLTLERAIDLFLKEHITTTAKSYGHTLRGMRDYIGPERLLERVEAADVSEYMQSVKERPTIKSPATINKHIKTIRTFFNWCIKSGLLTSTNPALGVRVVLSTNHVHIPIAWDVDNDAIRLVHTSSSIPSTNILR